LQLCLNSNARTDVDPPLSPSATAALGLANVLVVENENLAVINHVTYKSHTRTDLVWLHAEFPSLLPALLVHRLPPSAFTAIGSLRQGKPVTDDTLRQFPPILPGDGTPSLYIYHHPPMALDGPTSTATNKAAGTVEMVKRKELVVEDNAPVVYFGIAKQTPRKIKEGKDKHEETTELDTMEVEPEGTSSEKEVSAALVEVTPSISPSSQSAVRGGAACVYGSSGHFVCCARSPLPLQTKADLSHHHRRTKTTASLQGTERQGCQSSTLPFPQDGL